jgi:hypothetical protein
MKNYKRRFGCFAGLAVLGVIAGCPNVFQRATQISLGGSLNSYEVTAGEPLRKSGTANLGDVPVTLGSGTIAIDPNVITVTPTGAGKLGTLLQGTSTLQVTVWVGSLNEAATVCETGDQYGPFIVTLNANLVPTAVSPSNVTLTQATLDALNSGQFGLCIEIVSPVTGVVTISSLTFNLGL